MVKGKIIRGKKNIKQTSEPFITKRTLIIISIIIVLGCVIGVILYFTVFKHSGSSSGGSGNTPTSGLPGPNPTSGPPGPNPTSPPGPIPTGNFQRPIKPPENPLYNTLTYPSGNVDDPITNNFPNVSCTNLPTPKPIPPQTWPPGNTQQISPNSNNGTITFPTLITEDIYNMMFPYHNSIYSYTALIDALNKHPEGWRLGGEGSNETRKRDIAAFLANCAHEVGNGNGPSIINNTSTGTDINGPWSIDATYFGNVWGQKYFKCYCGGGVYGKDCTEDPSQLTWVRHTTEKQWCGSNESSNTWSNSKTQPNGWLGANTCISEGCPEYPPRTGKTATGMYCQNVNDNNFITQWINKAFSFFSKNPNYDTGSIYGGSSDNPCSSDIPCPCFNNSNNTQNLYYGRGPIQLSYNFNYGVFSSRMNDIGVIQALFNVNDPLYLLKNPQLIATNPTLIWLSAIDFWCSNRSTTYNYISCHDAIVLSADANISDHGFGLAINIVNGGCSFLQQTITKYGQPYKDATNPNINISDNANRAQWYQVFTYAFGISE